MRRSRKTTELALALAALVTAGCASTQDSQTVPHSPRERRLADLEKHDDYESRWRAAQVCAELADESTESLERWRRESFAKRGMEHSERACALQPDSVEGHYYRAITIGRYLEAERLPSFSLVSVLRDEGERAAELDPYFECSGAHRLLGSLYSEAPEWGPGGVGDKEKAEAHFKKALEFAPACPENHLSYAKFLASMENDAKARDEVGKARELVSGHQGLGDAEKEKLRERCDELARELKTGER
jgi:hypothetical protein